MGLGTKLIRLRALPFLNYSYKSYGLTFLSDGAGRSGVYIAIDANIELCEEDGVFDVYGYLKKMRGLRRGLVETLVGMLFILSLFLVRKFCLLNEYHKQKILHFLITGEVSLDLKRYSMYFKCNRIIHYMLGKLSTYVCICIWFLGQFFVKEYIELPFIAGFIQILKMLNIS